MIAYWPAITQVEQLTFGNLGSIQIIEITQKYSQSSIFQVTKGKLILLKKSTAQRNEFGSSITGLKGRQQTTITFILTMVPENIFHTLLRF